MIDLMNEEMMRRKAEENGYSIALMKAVEAVRQWSRWHFFLDDMKDATDGELLAVIHHQSQLSVLQPKYIWNDECRRNYDAREQKKIDEQNERVRIGNAEARQISHAGDLHGWCSPYLRMDYHPIFLPYATVYDGDFPMNRPLLPEP